MGGFSLFGGGMTYGQRHAAGLDDQATSGTYIQQNGDGGDINMAIVA